MFDMMKMMGKLGELKTKMAEAQAKGESVVARKLEQQIGDLEAFQERHPSEAKAPSPLEVFCDLNPADINCRVYDD